MGIQILDHEIPETEFLTDVFRQLYQQGAGIFLNETDPHLPGCLRHTALRRLQDDRHLGYVLLDMPAEFYSGIYPLCLGSVPFVHHKAHIGNHPEQIPAVSGIKLQCLIIVRRQQYFRAGSFPQFELLFVESLLEKLGALLEHQLVDSRKVS